MHLIRSRGACSANFSRLLAAALPSLSVAHQPRFSCRSFTASSPISSGPDAAKLAVTQTFAPKPLLPPGELHFGRSFTDHILSIEWTASEGWLAPRIAPYQGFILDPAAAVLHYAFTCFEGMKAYKDAKGQGRLFRPDKNMQRLNRSGARLALPTFDEAALVKLVAQYTRLESRFIPDGRGFSLYLRPTLIATDPSISVSRPRSALLYVIASPMGSYFGSGGLKAIALEATSSPVRAWPGGVGDKKVGGNYAPSIVPQEEASDRGFHQNLWLLGDPENPTEQYVTEAGTMNLFVAWINPETKAKELLTAPLDGIILPGVTRDSILELARERLVPQGWTVSERRIRMIEIAQAAEEGRLLEVFGAGTAAIVNPVRSIGWNGQVIECGLTAEQNAGKITQQMKDWIEDIQYGVEEHPWSYVV